MPRKLKTTNYAQFLLGFDEVSQRIEQNDENFIWDGHLFPYYAEYIKKTDCVLEVGSNIGSHTVYLSQLAFEVVAFEPQQFVYYNLAANLFLNNCINVKAYNLACYSDECQLYIKDGTPDYLSYNTAAGRSFLATPTSDEPVKAIKIDDLKLKKLDFVKIDAEGADLHVLIGMKETIKKFKPIIIYENHYALIGDHGHKEQDFLDFFNEISYDCKLIAYGDWLAVSR